MHDPNMTSEGVQVQITTANHPKEGISLVSMAAAVCILINTIPLYGVINRNCSYRPGHVHALSR